MKIDFFSFIIIFSLLCGGLVYAFDDCIPRSTLTLSDYGWIWSKGSSMSDIPMEVRKKHDR